MSSEMTPEIAASLKTVSTSSAVQCKELLGAGGQGEVYRAAHDGKAYALKWFFDQHASLSQRKLIENLIQQGSPGPGFLWPEDLVVSSRSRSFGYLMPLRESRFRSFTDLVAGRVDPSFATLLDVATNLCSSFHNLHAKGLCYRDINFGNGFFDPTTGETLICDNDNVAENNSDVDTVLGTPDFMAPEIVNQKAKPSRSSDYFSLSVLLFYIFHIQHPLVGKKVLAIRSFDRPAREKLFGVEPVFIFDPDDNSNEAISDSRHDPLGEAGRTAIPYWQDIYPSVLKKAFIRAFTQGISNTTARLNGRGWIDVLSAARNSLFRCEHCNREVFLDDDRAIRRCWNCTRETGPRFVLGIRDKQIALYVGKSIRNGDIADPWQDDASKKFGEIVAHPTDPNVRGLKNNTAVAWVSQAATAGATPVEVPPGKSVPLFHGTSVTAGNLRFQILASQASSAVSL